MGTNTNKSHGQHEPVVFHVGKSFCENVSHLIGHWNIFESDILISNTIPDKVMTDANVFGTHMSHGRWD